MEGTSRGALRSVLYSCVNSHQKPLQKSQTSAESCKYNIYIHIIYIYIHIIYIYIISYIYIHIQYNIYILLYSIFGCCLPQFFGVCGVDHFAGSLRIRLCMQTKVAGFAQPLRGQVGLVGLGHCQGSSSPSRGNKNWTKLGAFQKYPKPKA